MTFGANLNLGYDSRMQQRHAAMTACALVVIFGFEENHAEAAVERMMDRFPEQYMRDRLLHLGPVNLAAMIAEVNPAQLDQAPFAQRLPKYQDAIQKFVTAAAADYDRDGRTIEREARIRERARRIWEQEGHPDGVSTDHWLRAEREVAAERHPRHVQHPQG